MALCRVCATGMYSSITRVEFPKFQTGIFVEWKASSVTVRLAVTTNRYQEHNSFFPAALSSCRDMQFLPQTSGKILENHVIKRMQVTQKDMCELLCYHEPNCVSYNFGPFESEEPLCELNERNHLQVPSSDLVSMQGYIYRHILVRNSK